MGAKTMDDMKQDALKVAQRLYEEAASSQAYMAWMAEAKEAWRFYDGQQWSESEISKLAENGQPAIVINKIASKIDNIAGTEVANRTKILYRSRSGEREEEKTARALTDLALYVAERSDQAIEISNVFRAGLVTGIGWLDVGVESALEGPRLFNRAENELSVVWDPGSRMSDFSDARFVCRERWLSADDLKMMFPKTSGPLIEGLNGQNFQPMGTLYTNFGAGNMPPQSYVDSNRNLLRVIEVQHKKTEKRYIVKTPLGKTFATFDKKAAYADGRNTVESSFAPRVYVTYFSDNVLLSHEALGYQNNEFTLVPYVFKRERVSGQPYGLVRLAMDAQKELNKRRSKAMHLLNTAQVVADIDAVEDPNILAREAARPDGMILKRPGKDLRILRNTELAASQVAVMNQASKDIQEVMGVFDEALGKQSNATSGIAIQTRQLAGNLNQMFAFDALRKMKKKLGESVLSLIRQFFTAEMVIHITDDLAAPRTVRLNQKMTDEFGNVVLDGDGEPLLMHDVQAGAFDVHVEEVRDVLSSRELDIAQLNMLQQAGVPIPPQLLVEATNISNKEEILASLDGGQPEEISNPPIVE